jgi:UDP-glucose 4-epimerase
MRVVITGGAGFVGGNLCRVLADRRTDIVVVDDFSTGYKSNLAGLDVTLYEGSILDRGLLAEACAGADSIVHLAARASVPRSIKEPVATNEVNVTGTVNVLEAARGQGAHVVVASSSSVYGSGPALPKHEGLAAAPRSPYAASKLAAESYAQAYQDAFDLPTIAFRFFNIYGPLQSVGHAYAAAVPTFIARLLAGAPIPLYGDGRQTRDFTSVGAVTRVLAEAVAGRVSHCGPVNLAFGTRTSLQELIAVLEEVSGRSALIDRQPERAGDIRDSQADCGTLLRLCPRAREEPLRHGLGETLTWVRQTGGRQE